MLDSLMDFSDNDMSEIKNPSTAPTSSDGNGYQSNNNQGGYQAKKTWNNGGGNGGGGGGGFKPFQRKEEVVEEPYSPVTLYIDREFPQEIKQKLTSIASKLISKGNTIRYNGDDLEIHSPLLQIGGAFVEAYTPWKGFNDIESKHYWNTKTAKHMAEHNFPAWDKIPDVVKAMLARNVRMIFGDKNTSITRCLITWSPDGASKALEVTKDTGRASFIIKLAAQYNFPVINLAKEGSESIISKVFGLD